MSSDALGERFWARVDRRGPDECWEWMGCRLTAGYGRMGVGNQVRYTHRISWELINGPIPKGLCVLHHCDNKICVNPAHLFLGTQADNVADMVAKGRQNKGKRNGNAKLTGDQVRTIKQSNLDQRELAMQYGITSTEVHRIKTGQRWGWLR